MISGVASGVVAGVFVGGVRAMPGDGRPTAIFKQLVQGRIRVGIEGLDGDQQADRRVHGGPDKAVHHFPQETLARLAHAFPGAAAGLVAGAMGENISTTGCDETSVCIGDVIRLGTARLQLCQPRTPCWKIEARHGVEGMTRWLFDQGYTGWYYRVLEVGEVEAGDGFELLDRASRPVTLAAFWDTIHDHRPEPATLKRLIATPGLAEDWRRKLRQRLDWLTVHARPSAP